MAPLKRRAPATGALGLLPMVLLASLLFAAVARASSFSQDDEDLIFEEDGASRARREIEVAPVAAPLQENPSLLSRVRRQFNWFGDSSDDEDGDGSADAEGSGMEQHIYRCKMHVLKDWSSSYSSKDSSLFKILAMDIERSLDVVLREVRGEKTITVSNMRRSSSGKLEMTVDINYEGWTDETETMRRLIRRSLDTQFLGSIPVNSQNFSFNEPRVTSPTRRPRPRPLPTCRNGQHQCPSGKCVKRCDGRNECLDASDEFGCPPPVELPTVEPEVVAHPVTVRPVSAAVPTCGSDDQGPSPCPFDSRVYACFCDGISECPQGEDENPDDCGAVGCDANEFSCDEGTQCISASQQCNDVNDCADGTDEENCYTIPPVVSCRSNEYRCNTGECIDDFRQCDYMSDCPDGDDETFCPCKPDQFECISGLCISNDKRCDRVRDCDDGSDEDVGCPGQWCPEGQYMCKNGDCIDISFRCDGLTQCPDRSDEDQCPCGPDEWSCRDGLCIPARTRCDQYFDCSDYSDEEDCPATCGPTEWQCRDRSCIPNDRHCDGRSDCPDASDEEGCPKGCNTVVEWTCRDGSCVDINERCDGEFQCLDRSDEENCAIRVECRDDEWRCNDGECIPKSYRCDRTPQCVDKSDEQNCRHPPRPPRECRDGEWRCRGGLCIPESYRCNGSPQCVDRSDEENCPPPPGPTECRDGEWRCRDGACIPQSYRCDLTPQCIDRSDEENCPPIECTFGEYTCSDGSCIPLDGRCNGVPECRDRSDEAECPPEPCGPRQWQCSDGSCIREDQRCDNVPHCQDNSDESECTPDPGCRADQFRCEDNQCIEFSERCNGHSECRGGEDERGCACSSNEFKCQSDGQCIDVRRQCDGSNDCNDGSDERNCRCNPGEWKCLSGQCIPSSYRCDGRPDCNDNSDENVECTAPPPPTPVNPPRCTEDQLECDNGACVPRAYMCDGVPDCSDGSDEDHCPTNPTDQCTSNQFACSTGECIGLDKRCNNDYECLDGSDEIGCPHGPDDRKCKENEFRCTDGTCLASDWRCDNVPDCSDESDELDCGECKATEYRCGDGICIPEHERCDGTYDCTDESDERDGCCTSNEYQCSNGDCIPSSQRCNGYPECVDQSDESSCPGACTSNEFTCNTGECVSSRVVCDGFYDCRDRSDESKCEVGPVVRPQPEFCASYQFRCGNGFCIDEYQKCDGRQDCVDGSDERDCEPKGCQPYEFPCRDGQCISQTAFCDGRRDCLDGSDESTCTPPTPTPSSTSTTTQPSPTNYFLCNGGGYIEGYKRCDGRPDCADGSDEDERCGSQTDSIDLKTYPDDQTIQQTREVVFQCRDEGSRRAAVTWTRDGNRPMPPGTSDVRGRLTIPNVQVEHSGVYYCEAQDVAQSTPGRRKAVTLKVNAYVAPTPPTVKPVCGALEATCMNGQCIPRDKVCNGDFDCEDSSDEMRCNPLGCEPNEYQCDNKRCVLKTWMCDSDDDCGDGSDERDCITNPPDAPCRHNEFTCQVGEYCIPKSFHCDGEVDCQDGSDETGCSKPTITVPPPRNLLLQVSQTIKITCTAIGIPMPTVIWRLNWGHVPDKCVMNSEDGYGVLTCPNAQPTDQGAYSCEAINSLGSVFATPDCIVQIEGGSPVCQPPQFNSAANTPQDCLKCFCFGATEQCYSTDRYITQLPPPRSDTYKLVGVNQDQFQGNFVIRDKKYPFSPRFLQPKSFNDVQLRVDRTKLGGPSDLLVYFSMPDSHIGQQLSSYGGFLRYTIQYNSQGAGQPISGPDVIIRGNNVTLMHVHDGTFRPGKKNQVDVKFISGYWFKRVIGRGRVPQTQEPASREDIMMVLGNMDLLLIRALYHDGLFVDATLSKVQLDTAVISSSQQGRAVYVEECRCPPGYVGLSCQACAPNYKRVEDGLWLGRCVPDAECRPGEYGDPANGIACQPCPCPLTTPTNQFSSSCYLGNDGQVTCNCIQGYTGRRCERCSEGYEGNPNVPGDSCKQAGECNPAGSYSTSTDPNTGLCRCKEFVSGPKCDTCTQNSFYLNENNRFGCIDCFCMGITEDCTSSNWYRQQETVSFTNDRQGFELVDKYQSTVISNDIFVDSGTQELVFREFSRLGQEVYYWKLPQRFLGDKVTSYGGNLTYSLRYVPAPGGLSSANAAAAVEIYGNDIVLKHYSRNQLSPTRQETVSVPLYEQHWERQDGQEANREHFLMALADLEYILVKATYTTNTREVGLKEVILDYAEPRNTGQERAFAVEMCECPQGYQGLSCEDCAIGYTRSLSGLHLGTCIPCECKGHSEECDPEDGICTNCRDNTAGDYCDECASGYYQEESSARCVRIPGGECNCDERGSVSTQCFGSRCQCKANVRGEDCDACSPGYFDLSTRNPDGCLQCWCSGVGSQCFSSNYYRTQLPMQLLIDHGFTLSNRLRSNIISDEGFNINVANNEISFSNFGSLRDRETYYWSLPQMFTGNRLPSYGGNLTVTQRYQAQSGGNRYADPDVIIRSSGGRELIWMNNRPLQPNNLQTYVVPLFEENFTMNQQPASRSEFLNALSSVEAILVRATLSDRMSSTYLRDVIMDTAVPSQTGQARAYEVEQCQCPQEYGGLSCEQCKPGYYLDTATNKCKRCPCNGHEESCALRSDGGVRCDCLPGYYGDYCEGSGQPPPVTPVERVSVTVTISEPSIMITSIGSAVQFRCSARSVTDQRRVSVTWSKYDGALPYGRASDNRQGLLEISQVRLSDSGVYVCSASDGRTVYTQNATLTVEGQPGRSEPPRVQIDEPREVVELRMGQTLQVSCSAVGSPRPQVNWSFGPNRERLPFNVFSQNGMLIFRNAQSAVSGEYYCTATNSQGIDYARIIINIVAGPQPATSRPPITSQTSITVQVSQEVVEVRSGETVRVSCTAGRPGTMTINWTRRSGSLPSQAVVSRGELQIVNARPVDSGIYVCRITDERSGHYEESDTRITISEYVNLPSVSIQPDRQTINQGTNAELRCIVSGDPTPVITWSKVNEQFGTGVSVEGSILRIINAIVSDRGMYVCSAQNEGGTAQAAAIVEVERREPPVIEIYPEVKQTIVVGASALFQCHLTAGIPNPDVGWTRTDGRPLTPNTETLNGGVLRFNQVKGDEEGSYTCTAVNDAGSVKAVAILEIQSLPLITIRPGPSPHRVSLGQHVRLECSAQGDPAPIVSWQKVQVNFPANIPSQSVTPTVAVYEITSVSKTDEGTYQCSAQNAAGTNEERLQLIIEDSDQPPVYPPVYRPSTPGPGRPENIYSVPTGGNFELQCSSSERDNVQIEFKRTNNTPLPRGYRVQDGVLYLTNVDESAAGEYACVGADRVTGNILFTIYSTIQVLAPPRITLEPARQVVRPGDYARIHCSATGSQPITINWSKDGGYMPPSVIINGGEMMFRGIKTTDAGRYVCEAINNAGTTRAVAEVVVNEEPLLTAIQQNVLMYVGQTAELRCEASGLNANSVIWKRVDGRLPPGALPRGNLLRLPFIQPEDSGRYMCEARTDTGFATSDIITLTVERSQAVDIKIEPSRRLVRLGDDVVLTCLVGGDPAAAVSWSRADKALPSNAVARGGQLRISSVQADNGGVYRCTVTTQNGVFEKGYPLAIQGIISSDNINFNGVNTRSVKTRSVAFGSGVVMECRVNLPPPVSYTWSKQGGELPLSALVQNSKIDIPEVHTEDAGLYVCTGSNYERNIDLPTLLVVTGVVPRFTGSSSYVTLSTLPRAYLEFDLDISFKPESADGLILYNSQRAGSEDGDFVSFGMSGGHAEFRFDVGSGPAVIRSSSPVELNKWHTVRLSRNRKEGTMIVDDGAPVTGHSDGRFLGLDLVENMYLGSVPDFSRVHKHSGFDTGFRGCISRLVIGKTVTVDLMRDAKTKVEVGGCETCAGNPCQNSGVCQEAYTEIGHKCICPAGFSGGLCENTGEACYPGVCGTGRCINKPGGFECFCPFGKVGTRCEQDITIVEPAFGDGAYIAYPTPRALRRFSVDLSFKPENMNDGLLMYCAQKETGEGDFTSLAIRNKRVEYRFNTGSGTAILQSDPIQPGQWIDVRANRTDRLGSMSVNGGQMQNTESPGSNRGLNLVTPLFIGGIDQSRIEISPDVAVNQGFQGCVKQIKLMDQDIRLAESLVDSSNVGQCGGTSASMCPHNPCGDRGQCLDNPALPHGYSCTCNEGYSGRDCEIEPGVCSIIQPCRNGGACVGSGDVYNCQCPLGFAGQHCEHVIQVITSASFAGDSWVEFDQSMLPQDGATTQKLVFEFSTVKSEGLLFWLGQEPGTSGRGQDYISVSIKDGFVEFSYQLGTGPSYVRSPNRVNDGERHTLIVKRTGRQGSIELDGSVHEHGQSPGILHMLNTQGNIYIGGVPDLQLMTAGAHSIGFQGCIHQLTIGDKQIVNYMRLAQSGINVTRCPRSQGGYRGGRGKGRRRG